MEKETFSQKESENLESTEIYFSNTFSRKNFKSL
jgi:hypothetical protein